ncbi:MAG: hypothetical protein AAGL24_09150 [Pseudomonadota bacterium]
MHATDGTKHAPWRDGLPILTLCAALWLWLASLAWRYTEGAALAAMIVWLALLMTWLAAQIVLSTRHIPERHAEWFSTILQALVPTGLTIVVVWGWSDLRHAALTIATRASVAELLAVHCLRLAAWGTIAKWKKGELPFYFFLWGSIPDFGFAVLSIGFTASVAVGFVHPGDTALVIWSVLGIAAFLGAAVTMYFGVPRSRIAWRWPRVLNGREPSTLLPFRWPMNLAPAYCGPMFWLAHGLLILKVTAT